MIIQLIQLLIVMITGSSKNQPVHDLHRKAEPINLGQFNWTFILLTLAMVLFFVSILVFQIGNEYPNELMSNL